MGHIHGGNIEKVVNDYDISRENIIDFSVNTNFMGPPDDLYTLVENNFKNITKYPEPNSKKLKQKLAAKSNLKKENIIIGNGATEVIYQLAKEISPQKVLILGPTFSEYQYAVQSMGAEVEYFYYNSEKDFELDLNNLLKRLTNNHYDIVFICNPNNPTGKIIQRNKIEMILKNLHNRNTFLIVDESFIDFVKRKNEYIVSSLINKYDNLFILRSFTKIFSIPGIRLGYGLGPEEIIGNIEENRDPWSVNSFAQLIGEKIIKKKQYIHKCRSQISLEKDLFFNLLKQIKGIRPLLSAANFILVDIGESDMTSTEITEILAQKGIIIRNCNSFNTLGERYIRLAVKDRKNNMELVKYLKEII